MKEPIELTPEDKTRVWKQAEEHDKNLIDSYNWSGDMAQSFFDGAEYATKYERHILLPQMEYANNIIAGQSERIKELEALLKITPITHE